MLTSLGSSMVFKHYLVDNINPSDAEFYVNIRAPDILVSCVAMSSATTILTVQDKKVFAFHEEGFQLPAQSHC